MSLTGDLWVTVVTEKEVLVYLKKHRSWIKRVSIKPEGLDSTEGIVKGAAVNLSGTHLFYLQAHTI